MRALRYLSMAARLRPMASLRGGLWVRCPECHRAIRLAEWWDHGCERALVNREQLQEPLVLSREAA